MYFPYLYARRFELLAVRDIVGKLDVSKTVNPILEPVKYSTPGIKDLVACLNATGSKGVGAVVVMNPKRGDFKTGQKLDIAKAIEEPLTKHKAIIPGLICDSNIRQSDVSAFVKKFSDRNVALLYWNSSLSDADLAANAKNKQIKFNVVLHGQMSTQQLSLLPATKLVRVRDHFSSQERNSDYSGAEFFSDAYKKFSESAIGYGDYLTIGSIFREGGGPAHAVAIHATYKNPASSDVWVEHFVSDDTDIEVGTTAEKFLQAAGKLVAAVKKRPKEFGKDAALEAYAECVEKQTSPGLGVNKKLQIYHHIALNHALLTKSL